MRWNWRMSHNPISSSPWKIKPRRARWSSFVAFIQDLFWLAKYGVAEQPVVKLIFECVSLLCLSFHVRYAQSAAITRMTWRPTLIGKTERLNSCDCFIKPGFLSLVSGLNIYLKQSIVKLYCSCGGECAKRDEGVLVKHDITPYKDLSCLIDNIFSSVLNVNTHTPPPRNYFVVT